MRSTSAIFCRHSPKAFTLDVNGVLAGKTLAVKDVFALQGYRNSAGNPDWFYSHAPATSTADSVASLLQAGCTFAGLTHTDELAYSLEGNNQHYGIAENPKVAEHHCGGSSMGSVAAVSGHHVDIGLGTDTGGSIRVPASYCGVYGIRTSHNAISRQGVIGLAPSFDTVGWFCRDALLLQAVGEILLPDQQRHTVTELLVWDELFTLIDEPLRSHIQSDLDQCRQYFNHVRQLRSDSANHQLHSLADTFRVLQGRDIAREHAEWLRTVRPSMSESITARFQMALSLTEQEEIVAKEKRVLWQETMHRLLSTHQVLFLPSTPTAAPKIGEDQSELRQRLLTLTAIAGLLGACQIHIPSGVVMEKGIAKPYGFSLMMLPQCDHALLALVKRMMSQL